MKVQTKSKKVNKAWLNDHVHDPYVKMAQKDGYRARAAYKLKEIDETLGLVKSGMVVVRSRLDAWSLEPIPAPAHGPRGRGNRATQRHTDRIGHFAHGAH